jgi:predicted nucleic acid-binding protein
VQTFNVVRFFGITALDLTSTIVELQLNCLELQMRGIRAADALHVATAIHFNAEVFISVDEDLLKLNTLITNNQGNAINFCDTDTALLLI